MGALKALHSGKDPMQGIFGPMKTLLMGPPKLLRLNARSHWSNGSNEYCTQNFYQVEYSSRIKIVHKKNFEKKCREKIDETYWTIGPHIDNEMFKKILHRTLYWTKITFIGPLKSRSKDRGAALHQ